MRPFTSISPEVGRSSPAMERRVVVLPQPDGPSRVKNMPLGTSKQTSCAAFTGGPFWVLYSVFSERTLSTLASLDRFRPKPRSRLSLGMPTLRRLSPMGLHST